jgi:curved DNA-binding protein CbpA
MVDVMAVDPYAVLGLKRNASKAEINRAFRRLAKQHHPDLNQGNKNAEEHFKTLTAAYEMLTAKEPDSTALVPPSGQDFQYVAELESRYREARNRNKKSSVLGSLSAFFKSKRRD